jgi:hypothetical protein
MNIPPSTVAYNVNKGNAMQIQIETLKVHNFTQSCSSGMLRVPKTDIQR